MILKRNISRISFRLKLLFLTLFIFGLQIESTFVFPYERYIYREITDAQISEFTWELISSSSVSILTKEENQIAKTYCLTNGNTISWEFDNKNQHIIASRNKKKLTLKGTQNNHIIDQDIEIDSSPWFQTLSFSLRPWLKTNDDSIEFWMLRPDDLSIYRMKAQKDGFDTIILNRVETKTIKVKVGLAGILSFLGHAHYWFRVSDGLFIKYQGVHGPPGTPETKIDIVLENKLLKINKRRVNKKLSD